MPGIYKLIEVVGTSPESFAEAVRNAVNEAGKSVRRMDWFEVVEMRGRIANDQLAEYQVKVKIGFKLER
jgi:flavin-binding protein dodecin